MKEYIINLPHLQSVKKRIGALFVWAICWLMWIYLLVPLITLSAWLMGQKKLSDEMRWFGGYKSLLELLEIYGFTLLFLGLSWLCWVFYCSFHKPKLLPKHKVIIDDTTLCTTYHIKLDELQRCREAQQITVFFDDHGHFTDFEPNIAIEKSD